jgi:tetratricopeptide (TPR) repeat protein
MDDREPASDRPDGEFHALIRAGLARVLASDAFRAAPQLSSFLGFIVERAVEGRSSELKGYTIAVEAFGRSADFDPQTDPIVRVEAGRLRRALAQYYAGEGAEDPLRITMPVGAYVPAFDLLGRPEVEAVALDQPPQEMPPVAVPLPEPDDTVPAPETPRERWLARRWPLVAALGLCVALAPLAAWYLGLLGAAPEPGVSSVPPGRVTARDAEPSARAAPPELTVVAIAVPDLPSDPQLAALARRFSSFLVDALSRFDDLVTVKAPPLGQAPPTGADYIFEMTGQMVDGTMESFGRLRSVRDGRIVWSASSTRPLSADDSDLPEVARRLATRMAEPFGIIHADIRQNATSGPMPCIYQAIDVRRTMKPADHLAARKCVQELVDRDPTFYPGWVQLTFLGLSEYTSGLNPQPGSPLERALSSALTAVRLAPSSARAQQAMMDALFARGATEEAIRAGREALTRNPYDSDIMASLGARYIQLNRPAEGLPLVERAIELSAGRPPTYDFFALLGAHLLGAQQLSRGHGEFLAADSNPYALLGRALQAAQKGSEADKAEAIAALRRNSPLFETEPRLWLMRRGFGPEVIERILADLAIAQR